jgi:geranylgeranyl diphosphate synthase type I
MTQTLTEFFVEWNPRVEDEMMTVVKDSWRAAPREFTTMLLYHLGFANADGSPTRIYSGKRIRPMLVLLSCEAAGGNLSQALPAAAAVELLHNFSLIHDDIEDGDELRRGRATLWKVWGVPQAINAGDGMFAMAHIALERCVERGVLAERVLRVLRVFDEMCVHLTVGQHLDIGFETRTDVDSNDYMNMIAGKTAALTKACCEMGAILGGASQSVVAKLAEFGRCLGLSFQLQDDVLGIWGDPSMTGKADSDLAHRKKTLPVLYAADRNADIRARYFGDGAISQDEAQKIKAMIEAEGGRKHTENEAAVAYANGMEALASIPQTRSRELLENLAKRLLGRAI